MAKMPEDVLFDSRLVERHIRKGLVSRKDYEDYLKKSEDLTDKMEVIDMDAIVASASSGKPVAG
jgi:hypothetical protein